MSQAQTQATAASRGRAHTHTSLETRGRGGVGGTITYLGRRSGFRFAFFPSRRPAYTRACVYAHTRVLPPPIHTHLCFLEGAEVQPVHEGTPHWWRGRPASFSATFLLSIAVAPGAASPAFQPHCATRKRRRGGEEKKSTGERTKKENGRSGFTKKRGGGKGEENVFPRKEKSKIRGRSE